MERWLDVGRSWCVAATRTRVWFEPFTGETHQKSAYEICLLYLRPEIRKIWDYVESGYASICPSIEKLLVFVWLNFADHATLACLYPCLVNQEKEAMLAVWLLRPISLDTAGCLHLWMPGMRMRIFCRILLFPTRSCVGLFDSRKIYY